MDYKSIASLIIFTQPVNHARFSLCEQLLRGLGEWAEAVRWYEQSLAFKRDVGDLHGRAITLNNAQVHNSEGLLAQSPADWEEAIRCHQQALTLFHQAGKGTK